jgi:hypothetical protein
MVYDMLQRHDVREIFEALNLRTVSACRIGLLQARADVSPAS